MLRFGCLNSAGTTFWLLLVVGTLFGLWWSVWLSYYISQHYPGLISWTCFLRHHCLWFLLSLPATTWRNGQMMLISSFQLPIANLVRSKLLMLKTGLVKTTCLWKQDKTCWYCLLISSIYPVKCISLFYLTVGVFDYFYFCTHYTHSCLI